MINDVENQIAKRASFIAGIVAILAYIYILLRGYYVPPFCDEVTTFFDYILSGELQPFHAKLNANNHVLNSAISRGFYLLFGGEIFVLRMANMLAFAGYLFYAFRFKAFFQNPIIWLAWFITMVTSQFFMDFFHLSRGYGLSMMFLLGTLFHLIQYGRQAESKHFILGLTLVSLAVWSNLSLLLSAICIAGTFLLLWIWRNRKTHSIAAHLLQFGAFLMLFAAPAYVAILYGFELKNDGQLYYGAESNFWYYTVVRTVKFLTNGWHYTELFSAICIIALGVISLWNLFQRKSSEFVQLHLVLWGSIIGIIALHHLQNVNYPVDRAVLHLLVLFVTLLFLEIDLLQSRAVKWMAYVLAISTVLTTSINANLTHTNLWATVHLPKDLYNKIEDWKNENQRLPNVASHGLHEYVLSYYSFLDGSDFDKTIQSEYPGSLADLVVLKDDIKWDASSLYDTILYYPELKTGLMQIRESPNWEIVDSVSYDQQKLTGEFINLTDFFPSDYARKPGYITAKFEAECQQNLRELQLVFAVKDSNEEGLLYHNINLLSYYPDLRTKQTITVNYLLEEIPMNAAKINVFVWNVQNKPLVISSPTLRFRTATSQPK